MNRNEEFKALLKELDEMPVRGGDIATALQRLQLEMEEENKEGEKSNKL